MEKINARQPGHQPEPLRLEGKPTCIDLVLLGFLQRVASGELAHTATTTFDYPVAPSALIDAKFTVTRSACSDVAVAMLAEASDAAWSLRVHGTTSVLYVAAETRDRASATADELAARATRPRPAQTTVRVWHGGAIGASAKDDRAIDAPAWEQIAQNYPSGVRRQLNELHRLKTPVGRGKLILWHGEPGTGKTTAARSLFRSWADWCAVEYVTDPERFFQDPGYIVDVISRPAAHATRPTFEHVDEHETTWRLIVAEDADEHLQVKRGVPGPAGLSRLLNLSDGVLGQGVNSLILLTTNEPLAGLHPALVRPGRALAQLGFTRFTAAEGARWLSADSAPLDAELTLAELYQRQRPKDGLSVNTAAPTSPGQYL